MPYPGTGNWNVWTRGVPAGGVASGFFNKDREENGPHDPPVVKEGGRKGDHVPDLVRKAPGISNCEVVDARSKAGLVRRRTSGGLCPVPPREGEGMDVGVFRRGACPTTLKFFS